MAVSFYIMHIPRPTHVDLKEWLCRMSLTCPMSHVNFKKRPCRLVDFKKQPCRSARGLTLLSPLNEVLGLVQTHNEVTQEGSKATWAVFKATFDLRQ